MDQEIEKGRIALWLSPEDLKFLTNEWRKIPETVELHISETWARIAFRSSAALHQAGIENDPIFPEQSKRYIL